MDGHQIMVLLDWSNQNIISQLIDNNFSDNEIPGLKIGCVIMTIIAKVKIKITMVKNQQQE